jgi:DNA-binding response OmpR family regulator
MASILLIEDDDLFRNAVANALSLNGHVVTQAVNGAVGLSLFRQKPTDVVITDIVMPNKNGTVVVEELRREFPDVPIIAMSGTLAIHGPLYLKIATAFGATRTINKPFKLAALLLVIDEVLSRAR